MASSRRYSALSNSGGPFVAITVVSQSRRGVFPPAAQSSQVLIALRVGRTADGKKTRASMRASLATSREVFRVLMAGLRRWSRDGPTMAR